MLIINLALYNDKHIKQLFKTMKIRKFYKQILSFKNAFSYFMQKIKSQIKH